jgi:hypothetical protein
MLALNDRKRLPEQEIVRVLKDAATAQLGVPIGGAEALINTMIDGGNSVRRP